MDCLQYLTLFTDFARNVYNSTGRPGFSHGGTVAVPGMAF